MASSWCEKQEVPSYSWYFSRNLPGDSNGAWHSADLWYWFGTLENCWRPLEKKDYDLSCQMVDYLCAFAATGDPNGGSRPRWESAQQCGKSALCLGEKQTAMGKPNALGMLITMLTHKPVGE
jgi:para-nitrobenzyl esterase